MGDHATETDLVSASRHYRAYPVDRNGMIEGPSINVLAESDDDALQQAHATLGAERIEVWTGTRRLVADPRP